MSETTTSMQVGVRHHAGMVEVIIGDLEFRTSPDGARGIAQALIKHANVASAPRNSSITDPAWMEVMELQRLQARATRVLATKGIAATS